MGNVTNIDIIEKKTIEEAEVSFPLDEREFNQKVAFERAMTGARCEALCAADIFSRGYIAFRPMMDGCRYDLIADRGKDLVKVQVKTISSSNQVSIGWTTFKERTYGGVTRVVEYTTIKYSGREFDFLAAVDRVTGKVYYVPVADIDFSKSSFGFGIKARDNFLEF